MPARKSIAYYMDAVRKVHGDTYLYGTTSVWTRHSKIQITCPVHGVFHQQLSHHLAGCGCPQCAGRGVDWVQRFKLVHGDKYDYSLVVFTGYQKKVRIICPEHGEFTQTPDNHYHGKQGCPKCKGARIRASKQIKLEEFISRAVAAHGEAFSYGTSQFTNLLTGVIRVKCNVHGEWFTQSPVNHLAGKNPCVKCNSTKSKGEDAVAQLMSLFAPIVQRDRTLLAPKELDILVPDKRLAIEYCGDYWHSHGGAEDEAKNAMNHFKKYQACEALGIRLITMYESEWQDHNYAIRRLLRNATGKSRGKLMARKCELKRVERADATVFYDRYHPQGGAGSGEHYGLFWGGKLVACMRFTHGANDRGNNKLRQWTLTRYATRVTVAGGASRLFKAFVDEHRPKEVKSFSDNRYFSGAMYEALGFAQQGGVSAPDYMVYHPKLGTLHKSAWQRRNLPKIAEKLGVELDFDPDTDPRTERDITSLLGGRRLYDCGKKKWVWTA